MSRIAFLLMTALAIPACGAETIRADAGGTEAGESEAGETETGETETGEPEGAACQSVEEFGCGMTSDCGPLTVTWGDYPDIETQVDGNWSCVEAAMANHTTSRIEIYQTRLEDPEFDTLTVIWVIGDGTAAVIDIDRSVDPQPDCFEVARFEYSYTPVWENCPQCTEHALAGALLLGWRGVVVDGVPAC
jgi:hypothetical protein